MYYSAAWTDSEFLLGCSHEHETIVEAASCIPCAGGYAVGVENGAIRSLTTEEEPEFQCAVPSHSTGNPAVEPTPAASGEAAVSDSGYAVMTRVRVGDRWTWTTWMRFETYGETTAHAREGNKVVGFRSPNGRHYGSGLKPPLRSLQTRRERAYLHKAKEKHCSNSCSDS
jgi:hypothetical protein